MTARDFAKSLTGSCEAGYVGDQARGQAAHNLYFCLIELGLGRGRCAKHKVEFIASHE